MAELEKIVSLAPTRLLDALSDWLKTMHADASCPQLVVELQLHARRSPEFAAKYYALQESHTRTLAVILETYFKAHSKAFPIDATDLASCLTALAHGISLQNPVGKPGTSDEAGRIIDELLGVLIRR